MDSGEIYYSDNSQLIDENNSEWIRNTVLIENESLTWQEDGPEITVDYAESPTNINKTLSENDEYLTADNDDNTETSQYFSILESNDTIEYTNAEDNSVCYIKYAGDTEEVIVPDVMKKEVEEKSENNEVDKVLLYRMEGSEDLFAIQLADDGNGNYQKYKYKVRQSENGQFEAVPGSIEIQKVDENDEIIEEEELECLDQKPDEETLALINQQINEEAQGEIENNFYANSVDNFEDVNPEDYLVQNSYEDNDEEYQTAEDIHVTGDNELQNETIGRNDDFSAAENSESEYEIEELEEAFQDENSYDPYDVNFDNPQILQHKTNLDNLKVKSPESGKEYRLLTDKRNVTIYKDDKHLSYLVVKAKEKENVSLAQPALRSILKSSYSNKIKNSVQKTVEKQTLPAIILSKDTKAAKDASQVNTVVLKSARQPRKQIITPVERAGSEIIVQQLVYSLGDDLSNNFLVPAKRKRVIEEVFQVSDESDPEFTLKPVKKKKIKRNKYGRRGRPRNLEITILDSDEEEEDEEQSDDSVIEVLTDQEDEPENNNKQLDEKTNSEEETVPNNEKDAGSQEENSIEKITESKTNENSKDSCKNQPKIQDNVSIEKPIRKSIGNKKNKCPYCPKTFPRLINLKKHLNVHSTRRSLRLKINKPQLAVKSEKEKQEPDNHKLDTKVSDLPQKSQLYNCVKCKLNFLTESQFKRHQTVHITKLRKSPIKKFDKHILRSQSRSRNKQISPVRKTIMNNDKTKENFKCEYCGQIFLSRTVLIIHRNSHKTFPCPNCKTTFTAKLLLDDHLRKSCVKFSPKKPCFKKSTTKKQTSKCGICQKVFQSVKSLQMHKNISHKTDNAKEMPGDLKNVLMRKRLAHSGVPISSKMQQALSKLKVKS